VKRCVLWYDPTELVTHPDQTKDALDLHDRNVLSDAALLRIAASASRTCRARRRTRFRLIEKMRTWPPNLVMAFLHAWDPTLVAPAMTGPPAIPGISPTGVDIPETPPAQLPPPWAAWCCTDGRRARAAPAGVGPVADPCCGPAAAGRAAGDGRPVPKRRGRV
jgi:hypothetical protein